MKMNLRPRRGFTLVELLVAMSVIVVLAALVFTLGARAFERAYRVKCSNNIRQQLTGLRFLAADHGDRYYWPAKDIYDDSAPSYLYPEYINQLEVFICPSTKNRIGDAVDPETGKPADLMNNAPDRHATSGGHSYEYFGYYMYMEPGGYFQIKGPNIHDRVSPEWTVLILDGDDERTVNYPEKDCNHREHGWNWGFADGHVEWVTREETREMIYKTATGIVRRRL